MRIKAVSIAATLAIGAGLTLPACGGGGHGTAAATAPTTAASGATSGSGAGGTAFQQDLVNVIARARSDVVEISSGNALGSGVLFDDHGDVVTNNHVANGARTFTVLLAAGRSEKGTLVGAYPPDDLAVIHISPPSGLAPAKLGDSKALKVGDVVLAIGNPLGLASSVTEGIVSFNGRTVTEPNNVVLPSTIQTSAAINPGNSGGALVDLAGDVVGIPTLAATDQQLGGGAAPGIGFAIPSNVVKSIAGQIVSKGKVTNSGRAALGVTVADAVSANGQPVGALVISLKPAGPAANARIPAQSVITKIAGQPTPDVATLADVLAGLQPGSSTKVTYITQDGTTKTATVTLGQLS